MCRFARLLFGVVLVVAVAAVPAAAAVPANDTFSGAVSIAALPFSATVDTTEATTDADDADANSNCGAPATEASVWYALTPASSTGVSVDVSGSNYSAGVIVVKGSPGSFTLVTCGPRAVGFTATSGVIYYLLAFDDTPGGVNGGTLQINVSEAKPPAVSVTVNSTGSVDPRSGVATITGTFTCANVSSAYLDVSVSQRVGRFTVSGYGFRVGRPCDGQPHPWSADVRSSNGSFAGGRADVDVFAFACNSFDCAEDEVTQSVLLRH
jgi:Family of unknown function (DUF6299)